MNPERFIPFQENIPKPTVHVPAVESFQAPEAAAVVWPSEIATNENFLAQIKSRRELSRNFKAVFDNLPTPNFSLEEAVAHDLITEQQLADLYDSLSDLLESDSDYDRLILYLPFGILPNPTWQSADEKTTAAQTRFSENYLRVWDLLLGTHDVRANFIDGDVLEVDRRTGDLPRVVKAAHLVPELVTAGLLTPITVIKLIEDTPDPVLQESLADTLPVLADLDLLAQSDIEKITESDNAFLEEVSSIIAADQPAKNRPLTSENITLSTINEQLAIELANLKTADYGDVTDKRKDWLAEKDGQAMINRLSNEVSLLIINQKLTPEMASGFLAADSTSESQRILIEGIRKAIEETASKDLPVAEILYNQYQEVLLSLWRSGSPETKPSLTETFHHLHHLDIANDYLLTKLGIANPNLEGQLSENLKLLKPEVASIKNSLRTIETSPELASLFYPVALVYGSRLKGYGSETSDIDVAVFIKPEASGTSEAGLAEILDSVFDHQKIKGGVAVFWLKENGDYLAIRDVKSENIVSGSDYWTHIFFGGAWEGKAEAIKELYAKLLTPYLYETNKIIHDHPARTLYLEEMERDALQYRLMHKGYDKFFPKAGGINTPHSNKIDGDSIFWDSGYRQLATKLFIDKVFLPKLPNPEK